MLSSSREHVKKGQLDQTVKKEETTPGCPATMPHGPGTALAVEHSSLRLSALQRHLHQPLQHTEELRFVSRASSLHSSLALWLADRDTPPGCSSCASGHHSTPATDQSSASPPADCTITSGTYAARQLTLQLDYRQ